MSRFFNGFFRVLRREIQRMVDRPVHIVFAVFIPILLQLFMFYLFADPMPRDLPIALCDLDGSHLSREIHRKIDATPSAQIRYTVPDIKTGHELIRQKKIYALVVIPCNFESDVLHGMSPPVINYFNNVYMMPATLIYRDVREVVVSVSTDMKVKNFMRTGMMEKRARELATPIVVVSHKLFNPYTNYQYYLSGGFMPTVFQMLIIVTCIIAMGFELKEGTAGEWLDAANRNTMAALSGKLFPYSVSFMLIGIFMVTMLLRYAQVPIQQHAFLIIIAMLMLVLACQAVAIFFVGMLANMRLSMSVGAGYTALAFTYTGLTFPAIGMPAGIRLIGELIPLTHYLRIFISESLRNAPASTSLMSFAFLFLFLALPFFVMPRWHYIMREEQYWGRI